MQICTERSFFFCVCVRHSSLLSTNLESEVCGILSILFYNAIRQPLIKKEEEWQKDAFAFERQEWLYFHSEHEPAQLDQEGNSVKFSF